MYRMYETFAAVAFLFICSWQKIKSERRQWQNEHGENAEMSILPNDLCVLSVLPFAVSPLAVHHGGIHVSRRESVRLVQQGYDAQQDGSETHTHASRLPEGFTES